MVYNHGKTGEIVAAVSQDPQAMAFNALATCYNYIVAGVEPESTHLLDRAFFGRMRPGSYLVNTARGAVIARCWLTHTVEMSMLEIRSEETGREAAVQQIVTPWFSLPAEPETPDFLASNAYITQTPVVGCFFPVWRKATVLREVSLEYVRRPEGEVRTEAGQAALDRLKTLLYGYEIIDKWVDYCMIEDDTLAATATAEWLMDIAGQAPA